MAYFVSLLPVFFRLQREDWTEVSISDRTESQRANEASVWLWWVGTNWSKHIV